MRAPADPGVPDAASLRLLASLASFVTKWAGHLLPESLLERPLVSRAAALLPIGLLAALLAIQTFWSPTGFVIDARAAGVAVAAVALMLRAPFLVVVISSRRHRSPVACCGVGLRAGSIRRRRGSGLRPARARSRMRATARDLSTGHVGDCSPARTHSMKCSTS